MVSDGFCTRTSEWCLRPEPLSVRMVSVPGATSKGIVAVVALRCCTLGTSCLLLLQAEQTTVINMYQLRPCWQIWIICRHILCPPWCMLMFHLWFAFRQQICAGTVVGTAMVDTRSRTMARSVSPMLQPRPFFEKNCQKMQITNM